MKNRIVCWECGKTIKEHEQYELILHEQWEIQIEHGAPHLRQYCKKCHDKLKIQYEEENRLYIRLKKKRMFDKACFLLERQNVPMYEYKEAIEVVRDAVENKPDNFDSSYEIVAAIVLVQNRVYAKMQYKIGHYQVDFYLPEIGVVLEIDGDRHRYTKGRDRQRDKEIKQELGPGWDIIRIDTDYLDKKAVKLKEAIDRIIDYRETGTVPWRKIEGYK